MHHIFSAVYVLSVLLILSNELAASSVASDVSAVFNSEEWVLVQTPEAVGGARPPKATGSWLDPDAEIFVSIVEYRDSRCPLTLANLFSKAKNPKRIYVGEIIKLTVDKDLLNFFCSCEKFFEVISLYDFNLKLMCRFIILTFIDHSALLNHLPVPNYHLLCWSDIM